MARRQTTSRRGGVSLPILMLALLVLGTLYLYQSGRLGPLLLRTAAQAGLRGPEAHASQAGLIQSFFTTPSLIYPDLPQQRSPTSLLQAIVADLDLARSSVDLAVFDFDIPELTDALLRANKRGVVVRLIVDSENLDTPEVAEQTGRLQRAGVAIRFDRREPFLHNKFVVVDGAIACTGSWNATTNDTWRNNNNMLRFASRQLAADYANEFEQMFDGRFGTAKRSGTPYPRMRVGATAVEVYFSPQDRVAQHVLEHLKSARGSIRFMAFSFTSAPIADALAAKARAGLSVRGVFESQNASGTGAAFGRLRQAGVDVIEDGNCYIMHHKVIVVDERTVITGSYNFTSSAEKDNDENLVIVDDSTLARAYLDEFDRVYAQAQAPTRCQ
jgi:phosphatidylserine/phosphatidylglycerophosphate/cardiolipin synthase-like enzyme